MHDLATLVKMNEAAYQKAIDESLMRFRQIETALRNRGIIGRVRPITKNGIVIAADWWDDKEKMGCRTILAPDAFFSL